MALKAPLAGWIATLAGDKPGVFLAASPHGVKVWANCGPLDEKAAMAGRVRLRPGSVLVAGDFFDQIDDSAPELRLLDPHESLGQREPFGGGEKIRDVGG